jgi:hypothetical protein
MTKTEKVFYNLIISVSASLIMWVLINNLLVKIELMDYLIIQVGVGVSQIFCNFIKEKAGIQQEPFLSKSLNMAIKTKPEPAASTKRDRVIELMIHHKPLFVKEGVSNPKYNPRLCYMHKGVRVVSFYAKELAGSQDIYTEFCDRNLVPEDPDRTLWKWIFNPEFETEYELSTAHPDTGDRRFIIPISELLDVKKYHSQKEKMEEASACTPTTVTVDPITKPEPVIVEPNTTAVVDMPYDAMSIRDYAAIQWKVPVSQKDWLNELIKNTFK